MDWCATFEHGEVFSEYPQCVQYGLKHGPRFGALRDIRKATDEDPTDPYRLTYRLFDSSPARQRYLMRKHAKAHPGQALLIADMFTPAGARAPKVRPPRTTRGRKPLTNPPDLRSKPHAEE